ncbi:DUF2505 domain-containing protein [Mycobacterium sp. SMC-4]|uniref:DUF2505 domain-containing protein n=1 Tax=Mycobacterium sp. SMC-4 TaxID=2857059 RepID=UPI0021B34042|nr:DUF2505 domain-containing protein [Mycobacterium sp. SMC-4]UXA15924.1 DUF2505 domain-containing protein [Mycobacterium sp. SMC-4]
MPRPFDVSTDSTADVDAIHAAFGNEDYWRARLFEFGKDSIRLDTLTVDTDGSVHVSTTQDMGREMLPTVLAKAIPGGMRVMRQERWRRTEDLLHCDAVVTATGAPLRATGTALITPVGTGSRLRFTGTLQVKIPLLGGTVEKFIVSALADEIPAAQRFTTNWIAAHG